MSVVTLYSRPGCHLCDVARVGLAEMRASGARFDLREVNIEADDELHRRLLERIPVVEVDGLEVCELFLDADAVLRTLDTVGR